MYKKTLVTIKYLFIVLVIASSSLLLSGCATVVKGGSSFQDIPVRSDPEGAKAVTNSGHEGVTPCVLRLEKEKVHLLEISKEGYDTKYITIKRAMDDSSAGNFLLGGVLGAGIDGASGAGYKLVPGVVDTKLTKTTDAGK